jgi:hypothetical protein
MTEQPKEYYEKKPGFVIKSGTLDAAGKITDYAMITDNTQGFEYTTDGNKNDFCLKSSMEVCGKEGQDKVPSKVIRAIKGDIIIEALSGDIVLRGMNIRIEAKDGSGEITINSPKQVSIKSPIINQKGSNINTVASNSASIAAQATDTVGNLQNSQASSIDIGQASLLGKLLGVLTKFKQFFA